MDSNLKLRLFSYTFSLLHGIEFRKRLYKFNLWFIFIFSKHVSLRKCWIEKEDKSLHWNCIIDLLELFKNNVKIINVICSLIESLRLYFYLLSLFSDQVRVKEIIWEETTITSSIVLFSIACKIYILFHLIS